MKSPISDRGYSITPCPSAFTEKRTLEKRVLVDWLSASFDFVSIEKIDDNYYYLKQDERFEKLMRLIGYQGPLSYIPMTQPLNGYKHGYIVGENIKLFYGGEFPKNKHGNYTMQLLMSGEACREFENFLDGDMPKLMKYLLSHDHTSITRFDLALDVFDDSTWNIYDLERYMRNGWYTSNMRRINYQITEERTSTQVLPMGFAITLGSPKSSQLQVYDKRLERDAKDQIDLDTDVWQRYEMRFVGDRADAVALEYVNAVESNSSKEFMTFVRSLLYQMLDVKMPSKNKQRTRWKTHPKWLEFLDEVEKIDIRVKHRIDTTIERRKRWSDRSYAKVNAGFFMAFEGDKESFLEHTFGQILLGYERFEPKDVEMINNYRKQKGMKPLTLEQMKESINSVKEYLGIDDQNISVPSVPEEVEKDL